MAIIKGLAQNGRQLHVQLKDAGLEALEVLIELVIIWIEDIVAFWGEGREVLIKLHVDICDTSAELSTPQPTDFDFL